MTSNSVTLQSDKRVTSEAVALGARLSKKIEAMGVVEFIPRGEVVSDTHEKSLVIVRQGVCSAAIILADGRRNIVSCYYPGDIVFGGGNNKYMSKVNTAISNVEVRRIGFTEIERLLRQPGSARSMLDLLETQAAQLEAKIATLINLSVKERLAVFLLDVVTRLGRRSGDWIEVDLIMGRKTIANLLGLTVETLSRQFTGLRRSGILDYRGNSPVRILDLRRLSQLSPLHSALV